MMIGSAGALKARRHVKTFPSLSALRILIVEDDAGVADTLADMIGDLGHAVVAAERTRDAALATAASVDADIAILDINLGGRPAFPIADRLLERGIPVIFATGFGILELTGKYADMPLLKKPFNTASLAATLRRVAAAS